MDILLTGATGFLGSHLLKALLQEGHIVTVVKRSTSDCRRIAGHLNKCRVYDIDRTSLKTIFSEKHLDAVIHCATQYGKGNIEADKIISSNGLFPVQILESAISADCPYFINTDSFFTKQLPERFEKTQAIYAPEYTLSKYQFREWGRLRAIEQRINFINLQMEHIYGPDDNEDKFAAFLIRSMRAGIKELDLTDGIQIRDFIYVDDAITAYLTILKRLKELSGYSHFEVGTGMSCTVRNFVELIHKELGAATRLNFGKIARKENEIMFSTAHQIGAKTFGFSPTIPLELGIRMITK